jgi:hypothetical protein
MCLYTFVRAYSDANIMKTCIDKASVFGMAKLCVVITTTNQMQMLMERRIVIS